MTHQPFHFKQTFDTLANLVQEIADIKVVDLSLIKHEVKDIPHGIDDFKIYSTTLLIHLRAIESTIQSESKIYQTLMTLYEDTEKIEDRVEVGLLINKFKKVSAFPYI